MKSSHLNPHGFGMAAAILSAAGMLILSLFGLAGRAEKVVEMMQWHHIWFDLTAFGIIAGIIEAAVFSYAIGYLFGWLYNRYA